MSNILFDCNGVLPLQVSPHINLYRQTHRLHKDNIFELLPQGHSLRRHYQCHITIFLFYIAHKKIGYPSFQVGQSALCQADYTITNNAVKGEHSLLTLVNAIVIKRICKLITLHDPPSSYTGLRVQVVPSLALLLRYWNRFVIYNKF